MEEVEEYLDEHIMKVKAILSENNLILPFIIAKKEDTMFYIPVTEISDDMPASWWVRQCKKYKPDWFIFTSEAWMTVVDKMDGKIESRIEILILLVWSPKKKDVIVYRLERDSEGKFKNLVIDANLSKFEKITGDLWEALTDEDT